MKRHYLVMTLGLYVILMGVVGLIRTGSVVPVLITGSIALVTLLIAMFVQRGSRKALIFATVWAAINTLVYTYIAIMPVGAHDPNRSGSPYIFGSMAVVALVVFFGLTGELRRRRLPRRS